MMAKILITPRSLSKGGHPILHKLEEAGFELSMPSPGATPREDQLIEAIDGCVGWLAGVEPVTDKVIEAANDLRVISRNGTGIDNLPIDILTKRGIKVCRAEGTNAKGVAELALTLTLSSLRDVVPTHTGMRSGEWPRRIGKEISDTKIAVIGLGAIGATYANMCLALGAEVRGFDPFAPQDQIVHPSFTRCDFDAALEGAEVVSLHAPMPKDGSALMDASALNRMAKGAIVVNTARAGLVDDDAMLDAIESGQIGAYATDVFHSEPPAPSALLLHPRVLTTTHIGGFTTASVDRSTQRAVDNLLDALVSHAH